MFRDAEICDSDRQAVNCGCCMSCIAKWQWLYIAALMAAIFPAVENTVSANSILTFAAGTSDYSGGVATFGFASNPRAAQAVFQPLAGGQLQVTLTNTSASDVMVPEEILTALFFDIGGSPAMDPVNALLVPGSVVYKGSTPIAIPGGDVSGEWAYATEVPTLPSEYCISSVGLDDLIGPKDRFNTSMNLAGPESPDGMQFGIVSDGDSSSTGNGGVAGNAVIRNSVIFMFEGLPGDFSIESISKVYFHYGTSFTPFDDNPPQPPVMPEPGTMMAFLLTLASLGSYARRRINRG